MPKTVNRTLPADGESLFNAEEKVIGVNTWSKTDGQNLNFAVHCNEVQNFINEIRKNKKLRWGGDFNREDPIHIDTPINKNKKKWSNYMQLCDKDFSKGVPKWKIWKNE